MMADMIQTMGDGLSEFFESEEHIVLIAQVDGDVRGKFRGLFLVRHFLTDSGRGCFLGLSAYLWVAKHR